MNEISIALTLSKDNIMYNVKEFSNQKPLQSKLLLE